MRVNVNHPSFITFLDNVTTTILSNITVENYFQLSSDKKLGVQYAVLKLMKTAIKVRVKLTDLELRSFVVVLCKKNEESENYEFSSILNDISTNFETINEAVKPIKRVRTIKTERPENE
jgi:hypothetical protein